MGSIWVGNGHAGRPRQRPAVALSFRDVRLRFGQVLSEGRESDTCLFPDDS
jgi:hypothetical protein